MDELLDKCHGAKAEDEPGEAATAGQQSREQLGALQAATRSLLQAATNTRPAEEVEAARCALLTAAARAGLMEALSSLQARDGNACKRTRLQTMHRVLPRL